MRAAWYEKTGQARNVLMVGEMPSPPLSPGDVRVRLYSSGVNPSDVKSRAGRPMTAPKIVPHSDGAGIISEVGPGVPHGRLGERVWIWNGQWKRPFGTAAESIVVPQEQAVMLPDNTTFNEGACLGIPALTALRAMTTDGSVFGKTVLVTGGAGAVGSYAIQFARLLGAGSIIASVSSDEKASIATRCGADHVVNYRTDDIVERIKDVTNGAGADRIVEVDAAANVKFLPDIIARDGLYVVYGSGTPEVPFSFGPMIAVGAAARFFVVYELAPSVREQTVRALNGYLRAGSLTHGVARTFALDDVVKAHEAVESGGIIGNVVLTLEAEHPSGE